jgi:hypothetical protein
MTEALAVIIIAGLLALAIFSLAAVVAFCPERWKS